MDMERSLMHVHHFLKAHPSASWAKRDNDMPLRTVKTIAHTLAKLKGAKVRTTRRRCAPSRPSLAKLKSSELPFQTMSYPSDHELTCFRS